MIKLQKSNSAIHVGDANIMTEYVIVSDDDGHYYVIPADKIKEWNHWLESQDYQDGIAPIWCEEIGGAINLVKFKNYRIDV